MAEELAFDEQVIDKLTTVLKALADPNRLHILAVLVQHESCNCQLNRQLGLPPNLLSHHLRVRSELVWCTTNVVRKMFAGFSTWLTEKV